MLDSQRLEIIAFPALDRKLSAAVPASLSQEEAELGELLFEEFGRLAQVKAEAKMNHEGIRDAVFNNLIRAGVLQELAWQPDDLIREALANVAEDEVSETLLPNAEKYARALIAGVRDEVSRRFMESSSRMGADAAE